MRKIVALLSALCLSSTSIIHVVACANKNTQLSEKLTNRNLGNLENSKIETIVAAILEKNPNLEKDNFKLESITEDSASVVGINGYVGTVLVNFVVIEPLKELSEVLTNPDLGNLENNDFETITNKLLDKNINLSKNDFEISYITIDSAIAKGKNNYQGEVKLNFNIQLAVKKELSDVLKNKDLRKITNNNSVTIIFAILSKNEDLTKNDFILKSISETSAVAFGTNGYEGNVTVNFELNKDKPDLIELTKAVNNTNFGTLASADPEDVLEAVLLKNPSVDISYLGIRWNGVNETTGWANIYSLDQTVYIDSSGQGIQTSFLLNPGMNAKELSSVVTNKNLGLLISNDQDSLLQSVEKLNPVLDVQSVKVSNIGLMQATIASSNPKKYTGSVTVTFILDTSNAVELSSVITNNSLGKVNGNSEQELKKLISEKNESLDTNSVQIVDITLSQATVISNNPAKYKGSAIVTFSLDTSNAIDLKTVIKETDLLGIPDNNPSGISRMAKVLNSSLDDTAVKVTNITSEGATIQASNMAKYKGSVNVTFEIKTLVGYWYEWGGPFENKMSLDEINSKYNVVNVSFFYTETSYTMPTYRPNNPEAIKNAVAKLQSQGRRVLISMGGATGGNMRFRKDQKDDLKVAIKQTIEEYNFDGLDIDWEGESLGSTESQQITSDALRELKEEYKAQGRDFLITMAPELPYLRKAGFAGKSYGTFLEQLENYYDWINPQFYNGWGDGPRIDAQDAAKLGLKPGDIIGNDNKELRGEFFYLVTKYMTSRPGGPGNYYQIKPDKYVIGAATNEPARRGAATKEAITRAFNLLKEDRINIRGLMTWSVLWDGFEGMIPDEYLGTTPTVEWKRWSYAEWYSDSFGKLKNK